MTTLSQVQAMVDSLTNADRQDVSDGWHSFASHYEHRRAYNVALFNLLHKVKFCPVVKSWKHNDGEYCFGEEKEWFIVVAQLPCGQISNHYKKNHWDEFKVPEEEKSPFPFDGHTPEDVINRLLSML